MHAGARAGLLAIALHAACLPELRSMDGPGASAPPGFYTCGGVTVDPLTDRNHCGRCDNACPAGTPCVGAVCRCAVGDLCGDRCVDTRSDRMNCGACGLACAADSPGCAAGACLCPGARSERCSLGCVDLATDRSNCGACNRPCLDPAQTCVAGACACPADRPTHCGGFCVDTQRDAAHCGACDRACSPGVACTVGTCLGLPRAPLTGERLGTRRPTFRWAEGAAVVELCADRACARVELTLMGTGPSGATASRDLAPGVYFWRLRPPGAAASASLPGGAFRIDRRATRTPGLLPPGPDLNGDGLDDVLVSSRGRVALVLGRRGPLPVAPDASFELGMSTDAAPLLLAGDLRRGAFQDVVVSHEAAARVLLGGATAERFALEETSAFALATPVFDLNDDGSMDQVAVGATGSVFRYGALDGMARTASIAVSRSVTRAAPGGDVDGDGRPDVLLAAALPTPRAWVGLGSSAGVDRYLPLPPAPRSAGFGASLSCAGDVNGDGFADVLAGVGSAGAVVYLGGPDAVALHRVIEGPADADLLVGAAGDVDGDGFGDVIAVPRAQGEAWLFRGGAAGLAATPVVLRDARWTAVESLGLPGDRDGDGLDDVVAGAPASDQVHVFFGAPGGAWTRVETLRGGDATDFGRYAL